MTQNEFDILSRPGNGFIAYRQGGLQGGQGGDRDRPTLVFLGGFMSDMTGTKAAWLDGFAHEAGLGYLRFDYSGHGASEGMFTDGTIGGWLADALDVIDRLTEGPLLLTGSSMGGWIALLAALARPGRVRGLVGIAAAPDFTEELIHDQMTDAERATLMREGIVHLPSDYGETPYPITRALIEDGRDHLLLGGKIAFAGPVHLVQGMKDADVPWRTALRIAERLGTEDVALTLVKDGDHRLSRPGDLALIGAVIGDVLARIGQPPAARMARSPSR